MQKRKFKLNVPLRGLIAGTVISLAVDKESMPIEYYWRRRMVDAIYDGCIEILPKTEPVSDINKKKVVKESK